MQGTFNWRGAAEEIICDPKYPHTEILFVTKFNPNIRHGITKDGKTIYEMGIARDIRNYSSGLVLMELKRTFSAINVELLDRWIYLNDLNQQTTIPNENN